MEGSSLRLKSQQTIKNEWRAERRRFESMSERATKTALTEGVVAGFIDIKENTTREREIFNRKIAHVAI